MGGRVSGDVILRVGKYSHGIMIVVLVLENQHTAMQYQQPPQWSQSLHSGGKLLGEADELEN